MKKLILLALFCYPMLAHSQILYHLGYNQQGSIIYKFNLSTCEVCAISPPLPQLEGTDIVLLPDGGFLVVGQGPVYNQVYRLSAPPALQPVWQSGVLPNLYLTSFLMPNGTIYMAYEGLATFDLNTNTINHIGNFPSTIYSVDGLFLWNGQLMGTGQDANYNPVIITIDVTNPAQSTIWGPQNNYMYLAEGGFLNGVEGFYSPNFVNNRDIYFYDPATETAVLVCPNIVNAGLQGSHFDANSSPNYACICVTDAGTIPATSVINTCINQPVTVPPADNTTLDPNDILQYALCSNSSNLLGSIISTSSDPSFEFNPATMQTGVTYYVTALAGNAQNGAVDLTDPCLDFSNVQPILWKPLPSVSFTIATGFGSEFCGGQCVNLTVNLSGTPPFLLNYQTPFGLSSQSFGTNTGTIQVCAPTGYPPGPVSVAAIALSDAFCTCQ